jgi:hypothetical protein
LNAAYSGLPVALVAAIAGRQAALLYAAMSSSDFIICAWLRRTRVLAALAYPP